MMCEPHDQSLRRNHHAERARNERIDRLSDELRESMRKTEAVLNQWRAEGILPPKQPGQRI